MRNNIMVDLETLGVGANSVFLSLAAVQFDINTGETLAEFKQNVDLRSAMDLGLQIEPGTLNWWMDQKPETMKMMFINPTPVLEVLKNFEQFIHVWLQLGENAVLWGNAARFDLGILTNAYEKARFPLPWNPKKEMCYRTINNLYYEVVNIDYKVKAPKKGYEGMKHDPIYDCKYQIERLTEMYRYMKTNLDELTGNYFEALTLLHDLTQTEKYATLEDKEKIKNFLDGKYIQP